MAIQIANEELPGLNDDLAADMYIMAMEVLEDDGFGQYEISNWAKGSMNQCKHNMQYWQNLDYIGFGAGAHSLYKHNRWENKKSIIDYIDSTSHVQQCDDCFSPSGINKIIISEKDEISETMMMGLRLTDEGIYEDQFFKRFSLNLEEVYPKEISKLIDRKLIEWVEMGESRRLRLTRGGRLLGNQVFMEFILD